MEINKLVMVVTLLVSYQQDLQSMHLNLKIIQHMNIIYKIYVFLLVIMVVMTVSGIIKYIKQSYSTEMIQIQ